MTAASTVRSFDETLRAAAAESSSPSMRVVSAELRRGSAVVSVELSGRSLVLDLRPAREGERWFRREGPIAFSYRGDVRFSDDERALLERLFARIAAALPDFVARVESAPDRAPIESPASPTPSTGSSPLRLDAPEFPTSDHLRYLSTPITVPDDVIARFQTDGFVVLPGLVDADVLAAARPWVRAELERNWPTGETSDDRRLETYKQTFTQITNVGRSSSRVRALTHAPRLASVAAQLMGVPGVRLYCEDWLLKGSGEEGTGWHADSAVFPFETRASCTAWFPMDDVTPDDGLLRLARGTHLADLDPGDNITEANDARLDALVRSGAFEVVTVPPFRAGDVSFHDGRLIHGSHPNRSNKRRDVLALHLFSDGARIRPCTTDVMKHQLRQFGPGLSVGDPAASDFWPLLTPRPA